VLAVGAGQPTKELAVVVEQPVERRWDSIEERCRMRRRMGVKQWPTANERLSTMKQTLLWDLH
jgi:hypothetical protein